jgi:hypothetical protein
MTHDDNIQYDFFDGETQSGYYDYTPSLDDLNTFEEPEETDYFDGGGEELSYDDLYSDIDFSQYSGNYKKNMRRAVAKIKSLPQKIIVPDNRKVIVEGETKQFRRPPLKKPLSKNIPVKRKAKIIDRRKVSEKIIVPDDRKVIVEGVNNFILDQKPQSDFVKNIGIRDGKKLRELIITFNNDSALDFEIELFNPSMPLDFLHSTSLNINDKVLIAGGTTSYTDVLFNLLANPARFYASKFVVAGANKLSQINQPLQVINKNIAGEQKIEPFQIQLDVDIDQNQNDIIYFDLQQTLNRPFIPDGMDIIKYKVLAGMTVTFGFYYSQISLKKFFYPEAKAAKTLL